MSVQQSVRLTIEMNDTEAWALAQLCKRFTYEDAVRLSNNHDAGKERDSMLDAVCRVARSLADQGIKPR